MSNGELHTLGDSDDDQIEYPLAFTSTPLSINDSPVEKALGFDSEQIVQTHLNEFIISFAVQTVDKVQKIIQQREKATASQRKHCQNHVHQLGVAADEALQDRDSLRIKLKSDPSKPNQKQTERKSEIVRLLQRRVDTLKQDVTGYKAKCETLERRVSLLSDQQRALLSVKAGVEKTPLEAIHHTINERLELLDLNCDTVLQKICERRVRLENTKPKWESEFASAKSGLENTKVKLVSTEKDAKRAAPKSSIVSMLNRRLMDLKDELKKKDDQITSLKTRLEIAEDTLSTREASVGDLHSENESNSEKWKGQLQVALERESVMQMQLKRAQQVSDEAQFQVQQLQREREALRQQVAEQHSLMTTERCRTQSLIGESAAECRRRESEIFELQHEIQMRNEDVITQQAINAQLIEELSIAKRRISTLIQDIQNLQTPSPTSTTKDPIVDTQSDCLILSLQEEIQRLRQFVSDEQGEFSRKESAWLAAEALRQAEIRSLTETLAAQAARIGSQKGGQWEEELLSMAKRKSDIFFEKHSGPAGSTETETDRVVKRRDSNLEYLKNIFVKFMTSSDDVQRTLFPVISSLLQLSAEELHAIQKVKKDWKK